MGLVKSCEGVEPTSDGVLTILYGPFERGGVGWADRHRICSSCEEVLGNVEMAGPTRELEGSIENVLCIRGISDPGNVGRKQCVNVRSMIDQHSNGYKNSRFSAAYRTDRGLECLTR